MESDLREGGDPKTRQETETHTDGARRHASSAVARRQPVLLGGTGNSDRVEPPGHDEDPGAGGRRPENDHDPHPRRCVHPRETKSADGRDLRHRTGEVERVGPCAAFLDALSLVTPIPFSQGVTDPHISLPIEARIVWSAAAAVAAFVCHGVVHEHTKAAVAAAALQDSEMPLICVVDADGVNHVHCGVLAEDNAERVYVRRPLLKQWKQRCNSSRVLFP